MKGTMVHSKPIIFMPSSNTSGQTSVVTSSKWTLTFDAPLSVAQVSVDRIFGAGPLRAVAHGATPAWRLRARHYLGALEVGMLRASALQAA